MLLLLAYFVAGFLKLVSVVTEAKYLLTVAGSLSLYYVQQYTWPLLNRYQCHNIVTVKQCLQILIQDGDEVGENSTQLLAGPNQNSTKL